MVMCILLTGCGSKKTGKKSDWKTDKVLAITDYHHQSGWADSIIENKKYVIYTRKDRKIIRYDKETGEKRKLFQLNKKQKIEDMATGYSKMDLKTKKSKLVRGQEAPEDDDQYGKIMRYNNFYMIDGNFYYGAIVNNVPEKTGLYKYNTNGKDQLQIKDRKGYDTYLDQKGVYITKKNDKEDDLTLMLYANNKKKELPEKFDDQNDMTIIDGYLLYLEDGREDRVYSMIKLP